MKLEVAEETLMGNRIAVSIAGILRTPLPMPNNAEIRPAPVHEQHAKRHTMYTICNFAAKLPIGIARIQLQYFTPLAKRCGRRDKNRITAPR
jgi:hypothetical protein